MKFLIRHLLAMALLIVLLALFSLQREGLETQYLWDRMSADASFVLLCLILMIGPAAKFMPRLRFLLPWRRELGIAFFVGAVLHVTVYTNLLRWSSFVKLFARVEGSEIIFYKDSFGTGNWVGLAALLYAAVLAGTANDLSQQWLGKAWKFLQQQVYTLFVLVFIHAVFLLYLVIEDGRGIFPPALWIFSGLAILFQLAGFWRTVWLHTQRRRAKHGRRKI